VETLATSQARLDALSGPGIVADNNREEWVNKPTKRRRDEVAQYAKRRKNSCREIRLHEFGVTVQMRKREGSHAADISPAIKV
jgi:hypothetical protein